MDIKTNIDIAETTKALTYGLQNKDAAPYHFAILTIFIVLLSYVVFGILFLYKLDNILTQMEISNKNYALHHSMLVENKNDIFDLKTSQKEIEKVQKDHDKRIYKIELKVK